MKNLTKFALFIALIAPAIATAGHHGYKTIVRYETVICYETKKVPYTCVVVQYDECGCPHKVEVTKFKIVKVPYEKIVRIVEKVPCD